MTARSRTDIATEFLAMCANGQVQEAYDRHVAADFRHHNAWFPADRQSLLDGMAQSAKPEPNKSFSVMQAIVSADRVASLSQLRRAQADADFAVVHILRFEGDKVVEMWDVGQEIPKDSPNTLGMF